MADGVTRHSKRELERRLDTLEPESTDDLDQVLVWEDPATGAWSLDRSGAPRISRESCNPLVVIQRPEDEPSSDGAPRDAEWSS